MKRRLLITLLMLLSFTVMAQKKVSVKTKTSYKKVHYYNLPEIISDTPHVTYKSVFSNEVNERYTFGMGNYDIPATDYIRGYKLGGQDYEITVKRLSHSKSTLPNKVKKNIHKKKGKEGQMVEYVLFVYECFYNQSYNITIKDNLNEGEIIYNNDTVLVSASQFPLDFGTIKGYTNESALRLGYNKYQSDNKEKFESIANKSSTIRCFNTSIKNRLNDLIAYKKVDYLVANYKFKCKGEMFEILDSTDYYFKEGVELFNLQKENKLYKNAHSEAVFKLFDNNYRIYKKFSSEDMLALIVDTEEREEFKYAIKTNVFISALLTSRYDEAEMLYMSAVKEYDEEVIMIKESGKITPSLKLSNKEKCYLVMKKMIEMLTREQKLYESHKVLFSFYK